MAEKLIQYYKHGQDALGLEGKIQLAKETKIPSTQVALEPDTPEKPRLFKAAVEKITQQPAPDLQIQSKWISHVERRSAYETSVIFRITEVCVNGCPESQFI